MRAGPLPVALLLAFACAVGGVLGHASRRRAPDLAEYAAPLETAARTFRVDPNLLRALVAAESGGDASAVSHVGAVGLCQLMPETAAEEARRLGKLDYSRDQLARPALNLELGASYLARLLRSFRGEAAFALAAYNAGGTPVRRWRRRAPDCPARAVILREGFPETRGFVTRALRLQAQYAAE